MRWHVTHQRLLFSLVMLIFLVGVLLRAIVAWVALSEFHKLRMVNFELCVFIPGSFRAQVQQVHDDLLEHHYRKQEAAHVHQFAVNEGSPAHTKVAIKESESVAFLHKRLFFVLFVLQVFPSNDFPNDILELAVEQNDSVGVDDDIDP